MFTDSRTFVISNALVKVSDCIIIFVEKLSWYVSRMAHMTKTGRVYERRRALNNDLRRNIIQDIVENGGDFVTGFFPSNLSEIALKNRTKYDMVKKICKQFCGSGTIKFQGQTGGSKHLEPDDIELLRYLKTSRASMPTGELYKHVNDNYTETSGSELHLSVIADSSMCFTVNEEDLKLLLIPSSR